jgi:class 3 adenylate cyclase
MNAIQEKWSGLANLRHDLCTPLNAIIGYSEMLLEECVDRGWESISPDLQRIIQASRALVELIKAALDPAQIEARITAGSEAILDSTLDFHIRTSMNVIIGYTEMSLEQAEDEGMPELIPELRKIHTAAHLFLSHVCHVRWSQLETGGSQPDLEGETVPLNSQTSLPASQDQCDGAFPGRVRRGGILVVDDNPLNRETLTRYLGRLGHSVAIAENGQQALERIEKQQFDLVLLDIIMPVMDGFQVLARLKTDTTQRDIPVIIISSLDDQDYIVKGIRMGADDCLPKPFDPIILGARVEACLERKRWHDQEQEYLAIIKAEREKSEHLLLQMLPAPVAARLKQGETIVADGFEDVTVLFADIVNSTPLTTQMSPKAMVNLLNDLFCMFDDLVCRHDLEKIRAIGDEFVVAAGLLKPRSDHAQAVADFALAMLQELRDYNVSHGHSLEMRIGMETGPVIAGVIGTTQFSYDLWGDAINTASRMQSHGLSGRIHLTEKTYLRLNDTYLCEERGVIPVKGKGEMRTFFLNGNREPATAA